MPPNHRYTDDLTPKDGLTRQQRLFVAEYLATGSSTEAFRAAYPRSKAWQVTSLHAQATRTLAVPLVHKAIAARRAQLLAQVSAQVGRAELTQEWVLKRLQDEACAGDLSKPSAARVAALNLLGKRWGLFPERVVIQDQEAREFWARIKGLAAAQGVEVPALGPGPRVIEVTRLPSDNEKATSPTPADGGESTEDRGNA